MKIRNAHINPLRAMFYAIWVSCVLGLIPFSGGAFSQPGDAKHFDQLQAAYIYNIARYIEWPDNPSEKPISICVVESQPVVSQALRGGTVAKRIEGRNIDVKSVDATWLQQNVGALGEFCHLIYVYDPEDIGEEVTSTAREESVLWVASPKWQGMPGAVFHLRVEAGKIVIYIDKGQLERSGLVLGAPLLAVVKVDP